MHQCSFHLLSLKILSLFVTDQTSVCFLLHLGMDVSNREKPMSALNFGNDRLCADCFPRRACDASLRSTKSLLPLGILVVAEPVSCTLQQPTGLAARPEDSVCSHSAISALQLQKQKTKPTRLKWPCRVTQDSLDGGRICLNWCKRGW